MLSVAFKNTKTKSNHIRSSQRRLFSTKPSIPIIDIDKFKTSPQTVSDEMFDACKLGVFYCTNHDIIEESRLFHQTKDFFNQPLSDKLNIHVEKGGIAWRGYMPMGGEKTHGSMDRKEGLYLSFNHEECHPRVIQKTPLYGLNPAIKQIDGNILNKYIQQTTQLGNTLTNIISMSLGLETKYIQTNYIKQEPLSIFRLWKYPKHEDIEDNNSFGIGEHTDYGLLSIITTTSDGLQFLLPSATCPEEEVWVDIPATREGMVLVNIGDLLDRFSKGIFKSRKHRVKTQNEDRYTAVLFYDPAWDCDMEYFPIEVELSEKEMMQREIRWETTAYKELCGKYSDFLAQKVKRVFPDLLSESTRFQIPVTH